MGSPAPTPTAVERRPDDVLDLITTRTPTWTNHGGNQPVYARELVNPQSLDDLRRIVREAGERGGRVKPVASGHSFSDIVQTDDVLVNTKSLLGPNAPRAVLRLEDELWKVRTPEMPRVRVACGGTIRMLNAALASAGLAFANLGGYDAQTLIGAISTSTHGSGVTLPPLPDAVRSLVLVTTGGKVLQLEPSNGITDPAKFARRYTPDQIELKQDDDFFYAAVVSMGCMGIVYSVTVDVMPAYMLTEDVTYEPWPEVRERLKSANYRDRYRHLEVHVAPHPNATGTIFCNVVMRDFAAPGAAVSPVPPLRRLITKLGFEAGTQRLLVKLWNEQPDVVPGMIDTGLQNQISGGVTRVEQGYKIYNVGPVNNADVTAIEFAWPVENNTFIPAVDRLLDVIAQNRARGLYQNGPLALRFVKPSRAYLSMMEGRETCTCEIAMLNGITGGDEMLLSYEKAMYDPAFATRFHWGQRHELTGTPGWLESAYPKAESWLKVYRELNAQGVFNNHFTDRMGISVQPETGTVKA